MATKIKVVLAPPTPFWSLKIAVAKELKNTHGIDHPFSYKDREKASSWIDCACGNQDPRIPRFKSSAEGRGLSRSEYAVKGAPVDAALRTLGVRFSEAVNEQNPERAGSILKSIERRSACLLAKKVGKR
jgi:hypothetical protein